MEHVMMRLRYSVAPTLFIRRKRQRDLSGCSGWRRKHSRKDANAVVTIELFLASGKCCVGWLGPRMALTCMDDLRILFCVHGVAIAATVS